MIAPLFGSITRPLLSPLVSGLRDELFGAFTPRSLFNDGSIGVLYDNNDLTTMFVDAAGTTPATVNGLVGLQLDKSQGLALGAEIRSSGAVGLVGTATAATYNTSTGVGTVTRVDVSNQSFVQWSGLATGSWYLLTIQNTGANAFYVRTGGVTGSVHLVVSGGETKTLYVPETINLITITSAVVGSVQFTVSTIRLASGNHRYQSTTGSKPILRGTPTGGNLVTNGDFASGTGWTLQSGITISGGKLNFSSAPTTSAAQNVGQVVFGRVYRARMTVSGFSAGGVSLANNDQSASIGVVYSANGTFEQYFTASQTGSIWIRARNATTTLSVDDFALHDVTADVVTAPYGLQYDGVDDFLQTAPVNFTATDKMFVCAGVRKLSDGAFGILVELSPNLFLNNGSFVVNAPNSAGANYGLFSKGTTNAAVASSGFASPVTNVLSAIGGISTDTCILRVNGAQVGADTTDQGTGNYGNYAIYFGRRGGTSAPYNGLDFGFVIVGKTLTAAQISSTERYIAQRTGVSI